jgi:hypothetical protein
LCRITETGKSKIIVKKLLVEKQARRPVKKKWLSKPENEDYFRGPDNLERVQQWRENNFEYWKRTNCSTALQDLLMAQSRVIIGLISNLTGSTLQDDIANTILRMEQSGQEILFFQTQNQGGAHDCEKSNFKTKNQKNTQQLQLGRSSAG